MKGTVPLDTPIRHGHSTLMPLRVGLAILTALVAWAALVLQLGLIVERMTAEGATAAQAVWRFLGFFTILTNAAVAVVASAMAVRPDGGLAGPRVRLATAAAILFVGIVYSVALRAIWQPTGWQAVADHALHDATPPLFLLTWLFAGHGALRWSDAFRAVFGPLAYCLYALARGALDGWYAYWFLNPAALGTARLAANMALLLAAFLIIALGLIALDRWLARRIVPPLN